MMAGYRFNKEEYFKETKAVYLSLIHISEPTRH